MASFSVSPSNASMLSRHASRSGTASAAMGMSSAFPAERTTSSFTWAVTGALSLEKRPGRCAEPETDPRSTVVRTSSPVTRTTNSVPSTRISPCSRVAAIASLSADPVVCATGAGDHVLRRSLQNLVRRLRLQERAERRRPRAVRFLDDGRERPRTTRACQGDAGCSSRPSRLRSLAQRAAR